MRTPACWLSRVLPPTRPRTSSFGAAEPRSSTLATPVPVHTMKTQYYTATSLDGFIATEDDSLDWLFPLGDINETSYPAFIAKVGALAMA